MCAKSERTFNIKFFDLAKNKKLLKILDIDFDYDKDSMQDLIDQILRVYKPEKKSKLLTNPTLRILADNEDILVDILEVLKPDDIRVSMRKYNL